MYASQFVLVAFIHFNNINCHSARSKRKKKSFPITKNSIVLLEMPSTSPKRYHTLVWIVRLKCEMQNCETNVAYLYCGCVYACVSEHCCHFIYFWLFNVRATITADKKKSLFSLTISFEYTYKYKSRHPVASGHG